jgi:pyridoxamine 5'-phosphate oxidase
MPPLGDDQPPAEELNERDAPADPLALFRAWLADAERAGIPMARSMTLATASGDGDPSARIVALRDVSAAGFDFVSDDGSRKSRDLAENPRAALVFYWPLGVVGRQVRVTGAVHPLSEAAVEAIYRLRAPEHQLMDWASRQGHVIAGRDEIAQARDAARERFAYGAVPRPPYYVGARLVPAAIEFWQGRADRLHDRLCYLRQPDGMYRIVRLAP